MSTISSWPGERALMKLDPELRALCERKRAEGLRAVVRVCRRSGAEEIADLLSSYREMMENPHAPRAFLGACAVLGLTMGLLEANGSDAGGSC